MRNYSLSDSEERIATIIVNAAYTVHKSIGPGLLENIYEVCFCHELTKQGLSVQRQMLLPITYDGIRFDEGLRIDVLVEDLIICELKAVLDMNPIFMAQLISYLKLGRKRLGFLINFNVPTIKQGIKRVVI